MNTCSRTVQRAQTSMPMAARIVLRMLSSIEHGQIELHTPEDDVLRFQGTQPGPSVSITVRNWQVFSRLLTRGDIGFAETYRDGQWDTPQLAEVMTLALRNQGALAPVINGRWWHRLIQRVRHAMRRNSRAGSRRNIHAHYDIGNDFYRLWLDEALNYSAALFPTPDMSLPDAQRAKHERILQQLGTRESDHILEIGCGWGSFAVHAARSRGCRVTGITLSREQLAHAQAHVHEAGVASLVDLHLCDYREVTGRYDQIVSIEMFEAVGEAYWKAYFETVRDRLRRGGRALIQTITMDDGYFDTYRKSSDFIQQYIFPGGMLPSPARLQALTDETGLFIADQHAFGLDYAKTLRLWREEFDQQVEQIRQLGYDEAFIRIWRFYLAYCEAGFLAGRTDVMQLEIWRD